MVDVTLATFWCSALLLAYGSAGYPLLMYVLGYLCGRVPVPGEIRPTVSLIVPAYNEAHVICAKIQNCLDLDYPQDRLEILVASDGSTDGTPEMIQEAATGGRIRCVVYRERRGKVAVLNDLVRLAGGEILVFSDAATMLEPGGLRALVSGFAEPRVGCVSGVYRVLGPSEDGQAKPESFYWRYETFVRQAEARLGTMLGAHGALYAIRRALFEPLDPHVVNDDFVIPMRIVLNGYDAVYEPRAVAWEDAHEMAGFARRIRIMTGNCQQFLLLLRHQGWKRRPWVLWQLASHKGLRVLMPILMVALYASNAALLEAPGYRLVFAAQTVFFLAALLGVSPRLRTMGRALIAAPYYVCMVNFAALVALYRLVRRGTVGWS